MSRRSRSVFILDEERVVDVGATATQSGSTIHGVYSTAEKGEAAMAEMIGRDCAFTADTLSVEEWAVDPVDA